MTNLYEVIVTFDEEDVATYLVHAADEMEAGETAVVHVQAGIDARVNLIRFGRGVHELDYDGELGVKD